MYNDKKHSISEKKCTVSICCLTYNHEAYIRECLESFLMQKTDFDFEILIHDDASSDNTANIIKEYEERYPKLVKPIYQTENQFSKGNKPSFKFNFPRARGKYIAMCEGDDYWTDPLKLQKQVDFLEKNQNYMACFTNAKIISEITGEERSYLEFEENKSYSIEAIIQKGGGLFPTASLMFRNEIDYPDFSSQFKSGDRLLSLLLAEKGDFFLLNEVTCVYRRHEGGVFSSIKKDKQKRLDIDFDNIKLLQRVNVHFDYRYNKLFKREISMIAKRALLKVEKESILHNFKVNYKLLNFRDMVSFAYNYTLNKYHNELD